MRPLLVTGPDGTLKNAFHLAQQVYPQRQVLMCPIPVKDYYEFDFSALSAFSTTEWEISAPVNEFYINDVRRAFCQELSEAGYQFAPLISPRAHIDPSARIGANAIVHGGCFIGADSSIGDHCVLHPNTVLTEDVVIGDYVTLEANVSIREQCAIGSFVTICANSSVMRATQIGAHCYLNIAKQYSGTIPSCTFYSPMFPNSVQVI
ncbi:hypothetical protein [Comamonas testosteroni]|uniref:hypothetical protein n=1 Tax=Comamonas testosteroni TaxID=285 RepID=UPI0005B4A34F|nr:hypothetical protein [Comamonas testosteroni]